MAPLYMCEKSLWEYIHNVILGLESELDRERFIQIHAFTSEHIIEFEARTFAHMVNIQERPTLVFFFEALLYFFLESFKIYNILNFYFHIPHMKRSLIFIIKLFKLVCSSTRVFSSET